MKRVLSVVSVSLATAVVGLASSGTAYAAANPSPTGTGQPSQTCGSDTAPNMPNGFNSAGFAHAETVYAGSDGTPSAMNSQSGQAVSQYDVACFQVSQH
jgi:hypothetical protein